jgi:hypothetical protein
LVAVATATVFGWGGGKEALGVVMGGAVMGTSLLTFAFGVPAVVGGGRVRLAIALLFAKLLLLLGLVWVMLRWGGGRIGPAGLALGVTCFPAAAIWEAVQGRKD